MIHRSNIRPLLSVLATSAPKFIWFTDVRASFENFLLKYDYIIQQVVRKYRSAAAAYPFITQLYLIAIDGLHQKVSMDLLPSHIKKEQPFSFITLSNDEQNMESSKDFSRERKSEIFIKEALDKSVSCSICKGLLHRNSITIDHVQRKQDGGKGSVDNGQLTHPFCNSTYKN